MDLYTFGLVLGAVGLGVMGFAGVARHGGDAAHGDAGHGDAAHGGAAHGGAAHGLPAHGVAAHADAAHALAAHAHAASGGSHGLGAHHAAGEHGFHLPHALAWLMSPRVLFGILLGFGTAGLVLRGVLGGAVSFVVALALGIAFERLVLNTLWNLTLRFASRPALTLGAAVTGEATAVTAFDASGHGIVQIELDGQIVQVLGTLSASELALGHRVRAGETLRVEDVDESRNRCRVSLL